MQHFVLNRMDESLTKLIGLIDDLLDKLYYLTDSIGIFSALMQLSWMQSRRWSLTTRKRFVNH
jgi:hypothetical protein